jgi:hypothetical protein
VPAVPPDATWIEFSGPPGPARFYVRRLGTRCRDRIHCGDEQATEGITVRPVLLVAAAISAIVVSGTAPAAATPGFNGSGIYDLGGSVLQGTGAVVSAPPVAEAGTASVSSAPAKWLDHPTCGASTTTLTCTGRVAGIPRQNNNPLGAGLSRVVQAGLTVLPRYDCVDSGVTILSVFEEQVASVEIQNGRAFTISLTPDLLPSSLGALFSCAGLGEYLRDPRYYEVSVDIGWGFGAPSGAVTLLRGPIGTVSPA